MSNMLHEDEGLGTIPTTNTTNIGMGPEGMDLNVTNSGIVPIVVFRQERRRRADTFIAKRAAEHARKKRKNRIKRVD